VVDVSLKKNPPKGHVSLRDRVLPDGSNLTDPAMRGWR